MEVLVFSFLLVLFFLVRSRLSVDSPGALQHAFEGVEGFIQGQSDEIIGHHSEGYTPFLAALGFFILFCNLIGVIPGFESPTAVPIVPLGCALCAFVYYQAQGFKHAGIGYLKHFLGPSDPTMRFHPAPLAPLMVPIELISHLARVLSLTIRLFANMFAGDMVTLVFFSLVPHRVFRYCFWAAHRRVAAADLHFRSVDYRLSLGRGFGRALRVWTFKFRVSGFRMTAATSRPEHKKLDNGRSA